MKNLLKKTGVGFGFFFLLLSFLSFSSFLCYPTAAFGGEPKKIKFASINPYSGKAAEWGIGVDRGITMAADKINGAGELKIGKDTYIWEIRSYDNRYLPAESVSCFKRAIADGCSFICSLGGAVTLPLVPLMNSHKIINLAPIAGGVEFTNPKHPYLLRTMASADLIFGRHGVKLYKKLGVKKLATIMPDNILGYSDSKILKNSLKVEGMSSILVAEEFIAIDTSDFSPVLTRVLTKNPDHLEGGAWPPASFGLLIKQARELGYKGTFSNMTSSAQMKPLIETAGVQNLEGAILARLWPRDQLPSKECEKFWNDYESRFKEEPLGGGMEIYVAFEFLSAAIQKAQTLDPDKILEVMRDFKLNTMTGELKLIGKDDPFLPGYGINNQFDAPFPVTRVINGKPRIFKVD